MRAWTVPFGSIRLLTAILVLTILLPACSILEPEEAGIRVLNRTVVPIHVLAWEQEASYLVDPVPSFDFLPGEITIIPPGGSQAFSPQEISGGYETGDGVALFVYEVEGTTAVLRTLESFTRLELRKADYRIRISEL
jgi:hypothetical protein